MRLFHSALTYLLSIAYSQICVSALEVIQACPLPAANPLVARLLGERQASSFCLTWLSIGTATKVATSTPTVLISSLITVTSVETTTLGGVVSARAGKSRRTSYEAFEISGVDFYAIPDVRRQKLVHEVVDAGSYSRVPATVPSMLLIEPSNSLTSYCSCESHFRICQLGSLLRCRPFRTDSNEDRYSYSVWEGDYINRRHSHSESNCDPDRDDALKADGYCTALSGAVIPEEEWCWTPSCLHRTKDHRGNRRVDYPSLTMLWNCMGCHQGAGFLSFKHAA